jgi:SAM-dependent MidA family methyltransferase
MSERDGSGAVPRTPLAQKLASRIVASGPISVHDFMAACLGDAEHGYYRAQRPIGSEGDFITAPEISQVFGELLGLWSAVVWQHMGSPSPFQLIEIGPGRGTMMADALRASRRMPGFGEALRIVLVEPSPVLRETQRQTLASVATNIEWIIDLKSVAQAPTILLANEFLDVLPVTQLVRCEDGWRERTVGLDEHGALAFGVSASPWSAALPRGADSAPVGAILELRDFAGIADALTEAGAGTVPFAALFVDYGHEATGLGDTLQAVRRHRAEPPLASPGEADLTAQVDFEAAAATLGRGRLVAERVLTQAEFLGALGIAERASRLMAANPPRAGEIEMAIARLMSPQGMGTRFKVLGLRSPELPALPGFPPADDKTHGTVG